MTMDSAVSLGRSNEHLCARVHRLCTHDFRDQPWYLDNLWLISSYTIGAAAVILPLAKFSGLWTVLRPQNNMVFALVAVLPVSLAVITIIPLCGIVDSIQRQEPPFVIRLAVHPGKVYQRSRWIYLVCVPVVLIIAGPITYVFDDAVNVYLLVTIWGMVFAVAFLRASCACVYSVYLQASS